MSKQDKAQRILQAKQSVSKAMLQLLGARDDSDPVTTGYINKQLDILSGVRKTLTEIAEGKCMTDTELVAAIWAYIKEHGK